MLESSKLLNFWAVMETLHALHKNGVFAYLEAAGSPRSSEVVSKHCDLAHLETDAALLFVSLMLPEVVGRNSEGLYHLGSAYMERNFQNVLHFSLAYAPVVHGIGELVSGSKKHGRDIHRDAAELGRSSELYALDIARDLATLIAEEHPDAVVDLGCGSGHIVRKVAERVACVGIGVDMYEGAKRKEKVPSLSFIYGDVADPASWKAQVPPGKIVFIASMVMHEFLLDGTKGLAEVFTRYKQQFPQTAMYIAEYNGYTEDELEALPDDEKYRAAVYQFMHPLTKQGTPRGPQAWRELFSKCGVALVGEFISKPNATIYNVRLQDGHV